MKDCEWCGEEIPERRQSHAIYCGHHCHQRARQHADKEAAKRAKEVADSQQRMTPKLRQRRAALGGLEALRRRGKEHPVCSTCLAKAGEHPWARFDAPRATMHFCDDCLGFLVKRFGRVV